MAASITPRDLTAEAKAIGMQVAGLDAGALRRALGNEQARRFATENRAWIADFTRRYEAEGDPLAHLQLP